MNLAQVISELKPSDANLCIVARRPWLPNSSAKVVAFNEDYSVPESATLAGYEYFMGVGTLVEEVLVDIGSGLTTSQRLAAVIFYADHDAYPDWLNAMRRDNGGNERAA